MKQANKKHILFRYAFIITCTLIFVSFIVIKMIKTTVIEAELWNEKAEQLLAQESTIFPERGNIYASNGSVLATNLHFYTVRIDWRTEGIKRDSLMNALPALCDSLAAMFPGKSANRWKEELLNEYNRPPKKRKRSHRIAQNLSFLQYRRIKSFPFFRLAKNKSGFYFEMSSKRIKPYGMMASRSIGNVIEDSSHRGSIHGSSGLEMALDSLLYGSPGKAKKIQLTNNITNWETIPAKRGYDIKTTIDINIQDIVEEELNNMCVESKAIWGTAVLMEVATGEIKAISNLEWNNTAQRYIEGTNNAVLGYEPGSVMKPISMMMALEDGIVSNVDSVITTGHTFAYAGGRAISDSHGAASMRVREVIERSSNIGMAKIILRKYEKDPGQFYHRLKTMGFFDPLHTGIGGERIPHIDSLGTKNWDRIALSRMSYGYTTKIPPMCTLAMYNAIANDGKYVRPRLVKELMRDGVTDSVLPVSYIRKQVCSPKNAAKLRSMLNDVVWGEHGTGKVLKDPKVNISGKTGTCYTIQNGAYSTQKRLAFCGFFPYEKPKYSCIVLMLGANRGAARCSGMVLKNVALKLYSRGMLDNVSEFRDSVAPASRNKKGVMYASRNKSNQERVKEYLNMTNLTSFRQPQVDAPGTVPSVIGLGMRDAVTTLEKAGLNVRISGVGYVVGQSIKPGSKYKKGEIVNISLKL